MSLSPYALNSIERIRAAADSGRPGPVTWADDALADAVQSLSRAMGEFTATVTALAAENEALRAQIEAIGQSTTPNADNAAAGENNTRRGVRRVFVQDGNGPQWDADFFAQPDPGFAEQMADAEDLRHTQDDAANRGGY